MSLRSWSVVSAVALFVGFCFHADSASVAPLRNGSFNDVKGNLPAQWFLNEAVKDRGSASVEGGSRVLVLRPNNRNTELDSAFGVVQMIPADGYRGQSATLSVNLRAEGGATASAMALIFDNRDRIVETSQILSPGSSMEKKSATIKVPQGAKTVMIALSVTGPRGAAYFDDVNFAPGAEVSEAPVRKAEEPARTAARDNPRRSRGGRESSTSGTPVTPVATTEGFGIDWEPVVDEPLRGGPCMSWRCVGVGDPTIARAPDGRLMLWFTTVGIKKDSKDKMTAEGPLFGRAVSAAGKARPEFNYSPEAPVMSLGAEGDWDRHLETPSVRRDPNQSRWIMWYMGFKERSLLGFKEPSIGQAYSANAEGTQWQKAPNNPIYRSKSGWDDFLVTGPTALPKGPDGVWRIYFTGVGFLNKGGVGLLTSDDGENWKPHANNPVFKTPKDAWDHTVMEQTVVFAQGKYWMWYSAYKGTLKNSTEISIGLATSDDGVNWTRRPDPVLRPGSDGSWYDLRILAPDVIVEPDGSLLMAAYGKAKNDSKDNSGSIGFWRSK